MLKWVFGTIVLETNSYSLEEHETCRDICVSLYGGIYCPGLRPKTAKINADIDVRNYGIYPLLVHVGPDPCLREDQIDTVHLARKIMEWKSRRDCNTKKTLPCTNKSRIQKDMATKLEHVVYARNQDTTRKYVVAGCQTGSTCI